MSDELSEREKRLLADDEKCDRIVKDALEAVAQPIYNPSIMDGALCFTCGAWLDGESPGYLRKCPLCRGATI